MSESLRRLQAAFDKYKEDAQASNRLLSAELDSSRAHVSELRLAVALSESKLENAVEKAKSLGVVLDKQRKELAAASERAAKFNELIIKHEHSLNTTTHELVSARERSAELERRMHSVSVERDLLKSSHERLDKEHTLLVQETQARSSILANLELIKSSLERSERETKLMLSAKIEQLERAELVQRKQHEHEREQHACVLASWQQQYQELKRTHEADSAEHERTRAELTEARSALATAQAALADHAAKLHSNELIMQMTSRNSHKSSSAITRLTHLEEESREARTRLAVADKDVVNLKLQLDEARSHAKQYKCIADTMERTMRETSEAAAQSTRMLDEQLAEVRRQLEEARVACDALEAAKSETERVLEAERREHEESRRSLGEEKSELTRRLADTLAKCENTERILEERTHNRDEHVAKIAVLEEQVSEAQAAREANEAEMRRASEETSATLEALRTRVTELERSDNERAQRVEMSETSARAAEHKCEQLLAENAALSKQAELLQQELSRIGHDLCVLQKHGDQDVAAMSTSAANGEETTSTTTTTTSESTTNLLEINRYLRMQKEQLDERYDALKLTHDIEQQRMRALANELEFARKQCSELHEAEIAQLKNALQQLKQQQQQQQTSSMHDSTTTSESTTTTEADNMTLLLDTNRRLKDECESLNASVTRLTGTLYSFTYIYFALTSYWPSIYKIVLN